MNEWREVELGEYVAGEFRSVPRYVSPPQPFLKRHPALRRFIIYLGAFALSPFIVGIIGLVRHYVNATY